MEKGQREEQVRQRVERVPGAIADPPAHQDARADRQTQLHGDDAEAQPEWAIVAGERHQDVTEPEARERIEQERRGVDDDEGKEAERQPAVRCVEQEPGHPPARGTAIQSDAEHDRAREQEVGHHPAPPRNVPGQAQIKVRIHLMLLHRPRTQPAIHRR